MFKYYLRSFFNRFTIVTAIFHSKGHFFTNCHRYELSVVISENHTDMVCQLRNFHLRSRFTIYENHAFKATAVEFRHSPYHGHAKGTFTTTGRTSHNEEVTIMHIEIDIFKRWCRRLRMVVIYVFNGNLSLALRQDCQMTVIGTQFLCTRQHAAFGE